MTLQWTNETRKLCELVPRERNPRKIDGPEKERLAKSLDEFGQIHTIAIGPDNKIYDGHQRQLVWSAVERYGPDYKIDVRVASRELTERECDKLVVYLHRGAVGDWDWDLLEEFGVDDLIDWGFDREELELCEFDLGENELPEDLGPQIDKAEELLDKWQIQLGQKWSLGRHFVICADSTTIDFGVWNDALVLTDPPYGISIVKGARASDGGIGTIRPRRPYPFGGVKNTRGTDGATNMVDATLYRPVMGDDKPFDPCWLLDVGENQIIFGGNYFASKLPDSRCWIVWDKNNTGNFADAELAWASFDKSVRLYQYTWNGLLREGSRQIEGAKRMHPTQKPAGLFADILKDFSSRGDTIIDPYLGSGTTIIACEITKRTGIGVELDPAYCAVTLERWATMTGREPELVEG